jgi:hypothetical protein
MLLLVRLLFSVCNCPNASYLIDAIKSRWRIASTVLREKFIKSVNGLLKCKSIGISIQKVSNRWDLLWNPIMINIFLYDLDNAIHHELFRYFPSKIVVVCVVLVHPNFYYSFFVYADILLLNWEEASQLG